jgi:hypothetical protein
VLHAQALCIGGSPLTVNGYERLRDTARWTNVMSEQLEWPKILTTALKKRTQVGTANAA